MPRVALVMVAVADLSGSGGAERYFSDLFDYLRHRHPGRIRLITSRAALRRLQAAGHLTSAESVTALPLGAAPGRGLLNLLWVTLLLMLSTLGRGIDIVHICLPTPTYVPFAAVLGWLPRRWRPAVVITVIDCTVAHNLTATEVRDEYERQVLTAHRWYGRWTRPDGVFSWYQAFVDAAERLRLFPPRTRLAAARFCFTDVSRFRPSPARDNVIVFAGRLSEQKRPLLFVDAVAAVADRAPALLAGWRAEMYGRGVLEERVRQRIRERHLDGRLTLGHSHDLSPVFARSRLFVSTQALENFTSLAMLEAMAAGNAVIAENVGQTAAYVHDGENGFLVDEATPDAFAGAIERFLSHPKLHGRMSEASRLVATSEHTIEHAAGDIVAFWQQVAGGAHS